MYQLYVNEEKFELLIAPMKNLCIKSGRDYSKPYHYNNNYFICEDRTALKELAKKIKEAWIMEFQSKLYNAESMKIRNKYK